MEKGKNVLSEQAKTKLIVARANGFNALTSYPNAQDLGYDANVMHKAVVSGDLSFREVVANNEAKTKILLTTLPVEIEGQQKPFNVSVNADQLAAIENGDLNITIGSEAMFSIESYVGKNRKTGADENRLYLSLYTGNQYKAGQQFRGFEANTTSTATTATTEAAKAEVVE